MLTSSKFFGPSETEDVSKGGLLTPPRTAVVGGLATGAGVVGIPRRLHGEVTRSNKSFVACLQS